MNIGIVGLGLIGGSLAKSIKKKHPGCRIYAVSRSEEPMRAAVSDGVLAGYAVSSDETDAFEIFADCDIIFICTSVDTVCCYIEKLLPYTKKDCILTDVGSTKAAICESVRKMGVTNFIGGHPMAGSEKTGYGASTDYLFENAFYILTPQPGTDDDMLFQLKQLVTDIGAINITMEPEEHDYAVAAISHVPHIVAALLVNMVKTLDDEKRYMYHLAAGGFKDITRIASASPELWSSVSLENKERIVTVLRSFSEELAYFGEALANNDKRQMFDYFDAAGVYRESFANNRSAFSKNYELRADIEDRPGSIATVATMLSVNNINIKNIGIINSREYENGILQISFDSEEAMKRSAELLQKMNYRIYGR